MKAEKQALDKFAVLLKYDSRLVTQNKRLGLINDAEIKEHVSGLPDSGSNLDHVRIEDITLNGSHN
jgi:hypothetical protein